MSNNKFCVGPCRHICTAIVHLLALCTWRSPLLTFLRHISIAAVLLLVLYVWRSPLLAFLLAVQDQLLAGVDQSAFGALIVVIAALLSIFICCSYKKYIPKALFIYIFALVFVYIYCRSDAEGLVFWRCGRVAYTDCLLLPALFLLGIEVLQLINAAFEKPKKTPEDKKEGEPHKDNKGDLSQKEAENSEATPEEQIKPKFQVDDPIDDPKDDLLGYRILVINLYQDLRDMGLLETSFSVGVAASWGKGKTSYMKLLQNEAEKNGDIVVWFNPRASKRVEDIQEDFFRQFSEALAEYHIGFSLLVNRYLSALGLLEGIAWLTNAFHLFRTLSAVGEKKRINRAIDNIGRNIYVFVDDLDRLTGAEVLEVLRIIDKNADFHRTVFVAGYDKAYIDTVLAHHLGHGTTTVYTDKYFDLEVSLPEVSSVDLAAFTYQYIEDRIKKFVDPGELYATLDAWKSVSRTIIPHLDSLRHIKRYTNLFLSRYSRVVSNVHPGDFMLLTLLRYKDLNVYQALSRGRFVENGNFLFGSDKLLYNNLSEDLVRNEFERLATWDGAGQIIETLFPSLPADEDGNKYDGSDTRSITDVYRHICMADYFSLYFNDQPKEIMYHKDLVPLFSVPEEEVPGFITHLFAGDQKDRLEDFLNYKSAGEIATLEELQRLCLLLSYFLQKDNRHNVVLMLLRLYSSMDYVSELIRKIGTTKEQYKGALDQVLSDMVEIAPWEISSGVLSVMMRNPGGLYTPQECLDWILRCQKVYYKKVWGTDAWSYDHALIFGQITQIDGEDLVPDARKALVAMMEEHPDEFARELFAIEKTIEKQYKISLRRSFPVYKVFPEDEAFIKWLDLVSDEKLKYILLLIYRNTVVNKGSIWLPVEGERLSKDEEIDWLYEKLSNTYSAVPFVAGDYAMLRYREANDRAEGEPLNIIVQISSVDNDMGYVTPKSGRGTVQMSQVLPIPIDGVADSAFYYFVIRMASVTDGTTKPLRKTAYTYYMDRLRDIPYGDQTVYDMIKQKELKFVHEVQHWLREHLGEDNLRFRGPLLPDNSAM